MNTEFANKKTHFGQKQDFWTYFTFVVKQIRRYRDLITSSTCSQFHQNFMRSFFVIKLQIQTVIREKPYKALNTKKDMGGKMMMKLTPVLLNR